MGRLTAVTDAGTNATTFGYDELGHKTSQTDANGHVTRFEYDNMGRMVARVLPLGQRETMTYRLDSRMVTKTDFNGTVTTFAYDDDPGSPVPAAQRMGRLLRRASSGGTATVKRSDGKTVTRPVPGVTTDYAYYPDGSRQSVTKNVGGVVTGIRYVYDLRGRLLSVLNYQGVSPNPVSILAYTYDDNGNRLSVSKLGAGNSVVWSVGYGYDVLNRLEKVYHQSGAVTTYTYDKAGNRKTMARAKSNGNVTVATTYGYDEGNRLVAVNNSVGSSFTYTLDGAGRRLAVTDSNPAKGTTNYTYDALGRLVREVGQVAGDITYNYDAVGNRTSLVKAGAGTTAYAYDDNDRLTQETSPTGARTLYGYDSNGDLRLKSGETVVGGSVENTLFDFDAEDKMSATFVGTGADPQQVTFARRTEYVYDPEGNRVQKSVYPAGGGAVVTTAYLVDTTAPYAQVVEDVTSGGATTRYECGYEVDLLSRGGNEAFYLYDGLGSVIGLADVTTGAIVDGSGYGFDAYGMPVLGRVGEGLDIQPFLGVGGQQFDSELGLYYLRARYYAPNIGLFLSQDKFAGFIGMPNSLHKYMYASNEPVSSLDPSGRMTISERLTVTALIGVIGVAVNSIWNQNVTLTTAETALSHAYPDITNNLVQVLCDIATDYRRATDEEKLDAALSLWALYTYNPDFAGAPFYAWDVNQLYSKRGGADDGSGKDGNAWIDKASSPTLSGKSDDRFVIVNNQTYRSLAANYAAFGVMCQVTGMPRAEMESYIWTYKSIYSWREVTGCVSWAASGYQWAMQGASQLGVQNAQQWKTIPLPAPQTTLRSQGSSGGQVPYFDFSWSGLPEHQRTIFQGR